MTVSHLKALYEERRNAVEELHALHDQAEGRELTAEEAETEKRMNTAIDTLEDRLRSALDEQERSERHDETRSRFEKLIDRNREPEVEGRSVGDMLKAIGTGREGGVAQLRFEQRDDVALVAGTATDGAELVETQLDRNLVDFLQERIGAMQANARVLNTTSGNPITVPTVASHSTVLIEGETDAIARSAPQFSTVQLDAFKYAVLVQASRELLEDSAFPFVPFVIEQAVDEIGRLAGTDFITGSGSGAPQGIDLATTNVVNSAAVDAWTADELIDVYHAIASPYRQNAVWILNDDTVQAFRKLKDAEGQYLWQPGMAMGLPDMLFGKSVVTDNAVHTLATGNESVIFGDIRRAYTIRIVNGMDVAMSTDYAFNTDMVTWRFVFRADGAIVDENAVAIGENA